MTRPRNQRASPFVGRVRDAKTGREGEQHGPQQPPMCWPCENSRCPRCLAWLEVLIARKRVAK